MGPHEGEWLTQSELQFIFDEIELPITFSQIEGFIASQDKVVIPNDVVAPDQMH